MEGNSGEYGAFQQRVNMQLNMFCFEMMHSFVSHTRPTCSDPTHPPPVSLSLIISIIRAQDGVSHVCRAALIKQST